VATGPPARGCGGGDFHDLSVQGGLVVLDLDDQGNIGLCGKFKGFLKRAAHRA
jgi:hypothetical protein